MPGKAQVGAPADSCQTSWDGQVLEYSKQASQQTTRCERRLLHDLQRLALGYFLDNQLPHGLVFDRQRNQGRRSVRGPCSTSATGMGLMAMALAAAPEYRLLSPAEARDRVRACLKTCLERLPSDHGMMPHFVDGRTLEPRGPDTFSTIDSSWLAAGALWAAAFLGGAKLRALAQRLYRRMDWSYWRKAPDGEPRPLCVHGKGRDGRFLRHEWNRLNAETAFMYLLGIGAARERSLPAASWTALDPCYGCVRGLRFPSADLGLFVFQYSMELIDFERYQLPGRVDLYQEARIATQANYQACRAAAGRFATFRRFWGLSAGDGPSRRGDTYRCYSPLGPMDGTAHITATLASISTWPALVLENLRAAESERRLNICGRYGYSNVNVDHHWTSRDVVGIDLGATVVALDNFLHGGRVRRVFHQLDCVQEALARLKARPRSRLTVRQAS